MDEYHVREFPVQTGNRCGNRGATAQIPSPLRTGKQEQEPPKNPYFWRKLFSPSHHRSKDSLSHHKSAQSHNSSVYAGSMGSTETDGLETRNTSICEGHQQPPADNKTLGQDKLSLGESFHINNNPTTPNLPTQPATPRPISNEDSGATTPNPVYRGDVEVRDILFSGAAQSQEQPTDQRIERPIIQQSTVSTGLLHYAASPEHIRETGDTVEIAEEARPTTSGDHAAKPPLEEDYEWVDDTSPSDDNCNKSTDLDWLSTEDRKESAFMALTPLIPYSLSSVEPQKVFIRPPKAELQRVAKLRLDIRLLRREIKDLKSLLEAKDEQMFNENDEAFKHLGEFMIERHKRPNINDSRLELASKLFFASRMILDECGPLKDEIGSLEEKLASEERQLTEAEDRLYKSFGMPSIESEEAQGDIAKSSELPISDPQPVPETEHTSADHIYIAEGKDTGFDYDAYSTGSFEKYRINYHPLYIKLGRERSTHNNLQERRAHNMSDLLRLEEQQDNRFRVGLTLSKDDQEFLDSLPEIIQQLDFGIDQSQREIEELRAQCLEQGIIDEDDNYILGDGDASDNSDSGSDSDSDSDSTPPPLPPLPPSVRLRQPVQTQPPQITTAPNEELFKPTTTRSAIVNNLGAPLDELSYQNRIDPWLFDKLASSRIELALLATILSAMDSEPDVASLLDVLNMWDKDGAGMGPPQRVGKLDEATIDRLRRATREVVRDGFDRALVSSLFGLSLWGGGPYVEDDESAYLDDI
ncbi:hypothetical protein V492_04737 [Pseudogymnoascus sp. VKM F-4246]|nr:hypothetical protein V492_04737 [Pseudogymnoascus sp. VKM F-4246]